eukprot:TRINITY_DN2011_c0_g1_i1.p1 TRINITY_DN2011_c0_g1~~TRINITY_DN2011_c0_g1_i1.p1  ORF type:complete len:338 (-),score=27.76 TRINITY_DN2011_c0_g1_i1:64-1077(-)
MQLIVLLLHLIAFALANGRGYRDHHEGREGRRDNYGGHGFERHESHRGYSHISEADLERLEKRLEAEEFGYGRHGYGHQSNRYHREEHQPEYVPTATTPATPAGGYLGRETHQGYHFEGHHFNHYDQEHRYEARRGYDRMEDDFASFLYGYKPSYGETHEYSKEYRPFYGEYDERYGNAVGHHRLYEEYGYGYIPDEHHHVETHHGLEFPDRSHHHHHSPAPTPIPGNETDSNTTDTNTTDTDSNATAPAPHPHRRHEGREHRHSKYEDLERKYFYKGKHYRQETTDEYGEYLDSDPYYHVYHPKKPHHPPPAPVPQPEPAPAPEPEPVPAPERPTK